MKIVHSTTQSTRLRLKPVAGFINLGELRKLVDAAEGLPNTSEVYAEDLMKASAQPGDSWWFRGMSIIDSNTVSGAPNAQ